MDANAFEFQCKPRRQILFQIIMILMNVMNKKWRVIHKTAHFSNEISCHWSRYMLFTLKSLHPPSLIIYKHTLSSVWRARNGLMIKIWSTHTRFRLHEYKLLFLSLFFLLQYYHNVDLDLWDLDRRCCCCCCCVALNIYGIFLCGNHSLTHLLACWCCCCCCQLGHILLLRGAKRTWNLGEKDEFIRNINLYQGENFSSFNSIKAFCSSDKRFWYRCMCCTRNLKWFTCCCCWCWYVFPFMFASIKWKHISFDLALDKHV